MDSMLKTMDLLAAELEEIDMRTTSQTRTNSEFNCIPGPAPSEPLPLPPIMDENMRPPVPAGTPSLSAAPVLPKWRRSKPGSGSVSDRMGQRRPSLVQAPLTISNGSIDRTYPSKNPKSAKSGPKSGSLKSGSSKSGIKSGDACYDRDIVYLNPFNPSTTTNDSPPRNSRRSSISSIWSPKSGSSGSAKNLSILQE
ncbi:UNVERIFIED_CONTAM: hypothetical protein HDU68_001400 [Siphonaria sp. JEL0065]|nr:hypothetical protein HDU68_001400 [Siphonaria sp. JEL0065]